MNAFAPDGLLLIGIGNDSRGDDGLGWKFLDVLGAKGLTCEKAYRYQLQIEDAEFISSFQHVVFIDATREPIAAGFYFSPCEPADEFSFSTHRQSPGVVLHLAQDLFQSKVKGYVLAIAGYEWALGQGLSKRGEANLERAIQFFTERFKASREVALPIL